MDEIEHAFSSTQSETERFKLSKIVKQIYSLSPIYKVDLRHFTNEHNIVLEEDLDEKVDFVLARPPYIVQTNRKEDHAEHVLSGVDYAKDMARFQEGLKKPGGYRHVFYFCLQFTDYNRTLAIDERENNLITEKILARSDLGGRGASL